MRRIIALASALAALLALAPPAAADETPKRGGTLTYLIPADAPPSFDGHREATYATVHATAPFYSVLIRINPREPVLDHRFRLRSVHRDAEADRRRQDLHVQDPRRGQVPRRLAADRRRRRRELAGDRQPAAGQDQRAAGLLRDGRQGRGARPDAPWSSASNSPPRRSCRRSPTRSPTSTKRRSSTRTRTGTRRT